MRSSVLIAALTIALTSICSHAKALVRNQPQQPLVTVQHDRTNSNGNVSVALFAELEELSRLVDIAYCVGATGSGIQQPFQCMSRCDGFEHFELLKTWNTGPLLSDSCGYIALSHAPNTPRLIVAFRGTYSIANTIADLSTMPQEYAPYPGSGEDGDKDGAISRERAMSTSDAPKCENCTVHYGFYKSWQNTRDEILPVVQAALTAHPDYSLVLVGHSLGGAVAAFAGLELLARNYTPTITTFGEPKIGNDRLAKYVDLRFNLTSNDTRSAYRRVTHVDDPVPLLPLSEWGYAPHAGEIYITKGDLPPSAADLRYCEGDADPACIEGAEERDKKSGFFTFPSRFKFWQLLFAHRDYFWRLGLCLPGGDPFSHWFVEQN